MQNTSSRFPRQSKLAGKLRQYDVTYEEIAKAVGFSGPAAIEAIINGRVDYKVSIARKIKTYLSKKSKDNLMLEDILE
jgi:predicted transcriptional regulator